MKHLTHLVIVVVLGLCVLTGCYRYVDARTIVLDAETGEPIGSARVSVQYAGPVGPFISPRGDGGNTDEHGEVTLRVTRDRGAQPWWQAHATGYLDSFTWANHEGIWNQIERAHDGPAKADIPEITLHLWKEPLPTVSFTIPVGYRGFVRICPAPATEDGWAGQRRFECVIDATGRCDLPPAPVLQRSMIRWPINVKYEFQFSDGTQLPIAGRLPEGGDSLAAWPLSTVENCRVFIVGTESEAARERTLFFPRGVLNPARSIEFKRRVKEGRFSPVAEPGAR